jgi:hypothetical protein
MAEKLVLVVKMSAEHFCRLINRMLDLDSYTGAGLGFLDQLRDMFSNRPAKKISQTAHVMSLVVDFQRCSAR